MFRMRPRPVVFWTTSWTLVRQQGPGKDIKRPFVTRRPSADFFYAHEKISAGDFTENVSYEPKTGCLLDNIVDACSTTRPQKTSGKAFCYPRDRCGFFLCTRKKKCWRFHRKCFVWRQDRLSSEAPEKTLKDLLLSAGQVRNFFVHTKKKKCW